jgi:choline kinase
MRAIILAAGAGTRLSPLTDGCPKCLVPMGPGPLIDRQLEALRGVGADDVVLVVGYEGEQVRRHCGPRVRYLENPDYLTTNSIYSLYLARHELDADTFLFNCDILFHPEVLARMLVAGRPAVVAVDARAERAAGEMNVATDTQGRITAISKRLDPAQAQAQSVQLAWFGAAAARVLRDEVARLVEGQERDAFPTSAYGPLVRAGRIYAVEAGDLPWTEIDSLVDYERAVQQVLPRLAAMAAGPRS